MVSGYPISSVYFSGEEIANCAEDSTGLTGARVLDVGNAGGRKGYSVGGVVQTETLHRCMALVPVAYPRGTEAIDGELIIH